VETKQTVSFVSVNMLIIHKTSECICVIKPELAECQIIPETIWAESSWCLLASEQQYETSLPSPPNIQIGSSRTNVQKYLGPPLLF